MNSCRTFNCTKTHTVDVHFQALPFDSIRVAFWWVVNIYKLTTAVGTNVILFTSALPVFPNLRRLTVWTLHSTYPQFISLLCNAGRNLHFLKFSRWKRVKNAESEGVRVVLSAIIVGTNISKVPEKYPKRFEKIRKSTKKHEKKRERRMALNSSGHEQGGWRDYSGLVQRYKTKLTTRTYKISTSLAERLNSEAKRRKVGVSDLVGFLLTDGLNRIESGELKLKTRTLDLQVIEYSLEQ